MCSRAPGEALKTAVLRRARDPHGAADPPGAIIGLGDDHIVALKLDVEMPYYRSGVCKCPKCGKSLFDGPSVAEDNTEISCRACKHGTTVKEAEAFCKADANR